MATLAAPSAAISAIAGPAAGTGSFGGAGRGGQPQATSVGSKARISATNSTDSAAWSRIIATEMSRLRLGAI